MGYETNKFKNCIKVSSGHRNGPYEDQDFEILTPKMHGQSAIPYWHLLARIRVTDNGEALA
jgi:hypothetical protein